MRRSALVWRLEKYTELMPGERLALEQAERRERRASAGTPLVQEGQENDTLFVIQHGWLHSSRRLQTGGRQILGFHYAGDLIGTSSIAWAHSATTITAVEDCIVLELTKVALGHIFGEHPRLAGLLYAVAAAEAVAAADRLTSLGRMDADLRIATLLLDMLARLRVTAGGVVDSFDLPLTQTELGDAVGLTKVHVNRTLRAIEERGWIQRTGRRVRIVNEAELAAMVGFVDRYREVDTSWLPPPLERDRRAMSAA